MIREDLKPCPFCGAPAKTWEWNHGAAVQCSEFDSTWHIVEICGRTLEDAIEAWEKRADGQETKEV